MSADVSIPLEDGKGVLEVEHRDDIELPEGCAFATPSALGGTTVYYWILTEESDED